MSIADISQTLQLTPKHSGWINSTDDFVVNRHFNFLHKQKLSDEIQKLFLFVLVNWPFSICSIKWVDSSSLQFQVLIKHQQQREGDKDRMDWVLDCRGAQDLYEFDLWPEQEAWRRSRPGRINRVQTRVWPGNFSLREVLRERLFTGPEPLTDLL